jgi:N-acylneuraminate cytidylyltransferase
MRLAVIPARGGSKRIPRKNIRPFCGMPIIGYSIAAARASGVFDNVVVSTDDPEIAEVARRHGAETPFSRPAELASDFAGTLPVIRHAIEAMRDRGVDPELVCCIYATAPFIEAADLRRGLEALLASDADYAFTATSFGYPIHRAFTINANGRIEMFQPDNYRKRSQDLAEAFHDAGQFYWGKPAAFIADLPVFTERSIPVLLPRHQVQDIDTPEDWVRAELMYKAWRQTGPG